MGVADADGWLSCLGLVLCLRILAPAAGLATGDAMLCSATNSPSSPS